MNALHFISLNLPECLYHGQIWSCDVAGPRKFRLQPTDYCHRRCVLVPLGRGLEFWLLHLREWASLHRPRRLPAIGPDKREAASLALLLCRAYGTRTFLGER